MLLLIRNLKRKMFKTGKFKVYILLAVGELILVTLGILGAFQIEEWDENLKNRNKEQVYFNNLTIDLSKQANEIKGQLRAEKAVKKSLDFIVECINKEFVDIDLKKYNQSIAVITINRTLNLYDATFEDLTNTGNLRLILNEDLKSRILDYYQSLDRGIKVLKKNSEGYHYFSMNAVLSRGLINMDLTGMNALYDRPTPLNQKNIFNSQIDGHLNHQLQEKFRDRSNLQILKNAVSYRKWSNNASLVFLEGIGGKTDALLSGINAHIIKN